MRELVFSDIYKMSRILKKMDLKIDINEDMGQVEAGAEMVLTVFENLHMAQKEVSEFMSDLIGISAEEFDNLPFSEADKYIQEFKTMPGIENFFKAAGRLMK